MDLAASTVAQAGQARLRPAHDLRGAARRRADVHPRALGARQADGRRGQRRRGRARARTSRSRATSCSCTRAPGSSGRSRKWGLVADAGGAYLLPRLVGLPRAKAMVMLGEGATGAEAVDLGLAYRCVDDARRAAARGRRARARGSPPGPTRSLGLSKRLLNASFETDLAHALELEGAFQALATTSTDLVEGMAAFQDRRDPNFTGRLDTRVLSVTPASGSARRPGRAESSRTGSRNGSVRRQGRDRHRCGARHRARRGAAARGGGRRGRRERPRRRAAAARAPTSARRSRSSTRSPPPAAGRVANYDDIAVVGRRRGAGRAGRRRRSAASTCSSTTPGILRDKMSFNMDEDEWDAVIDVHLKGHFAPSRFAAAYWRQQSQGDRRAGRRGDRQHRVGVGPLRQRRPGQLRGGQGRHRVDDDRDGARARAHRRARQRDRAGRAHPAHRGASPATS